MGQHHTGGVAKKVDAEQPAVLETFLKTVAFGVVTQNEPIAPRYCKARGTNSLRYRPSIAMTS